VSKPGTYPSLKLEDIPEEHREWMEPVFRQLNNTLTTHNNILNKSISVGDNVNSIVSDLKVSPVQGGGFPKITMKNSLAGKPTHVLISSATDSNGNPVSLGNPAWRINGNGDIEVTAISGLDQTQVTNLRFLVLGS
jgi:hypothetical protein